MSQLENCFLSVYNNDPTELKFALSSKDISPFILNTLDPFNSKNPLIFSARHGYTECLQILIDFGCDVHQKHRNLTALHYAAQHGHPQAVNLLLAAGADVNLKDASFYKTPLHFAAEGDNPDCLTQLIEAGADVNALAYRCNSPASIAVEYNKATNLLRLIHAGADLSIIVNLKTLTQIAEEKKFYDCLSIITAHQESQVLKQDTSNHTKTSKVSLRI